MQTSAPTEILLQLARSHEASLVRPPRSNRPARTPALRRRLGIAVVRLGTWLGGGADLRPVRA